MNIFSDIIDVVNRRHFKGSYSVLPGDNRVTGVYCFRSVCVLEILGNMWKGRRGDGWNF